MVLGDLNFDYLHAEKGNALKNVCDIFDLTNLIKNPTCFKIFIIKIFITSKQSF
jgi:hypothetical protein